VDGEAIYWSEARPTEGGRNVLARRSPDGREIDLTPAPFNVRNRVHEYGGQSYLVHRGEIFFVNYADQRLFRLKPGQEPQPLTPEKLDYRYADFTFDEARQRLICVREDHTRPGQEAVNTIAAVSLQGNDAGEVLVSGNNFYSNPRLSPDGKSLSWLTWNHPNMPWDGSEVWLSPLQADGKPGPAELVAGGRAESIFQPEWSPDSTLYFVSDRTGWWNLYRSKDGRVEALCPMEAEFGLPQWVFGLTTYTFESASSLLCTYFQKGAWHLARLDIDSGQLTELKTPFSEFGSIHLHQGFAIMGVGLITEPRAIVRYELASGNIEVLKRASQLEIDPGYFSRPTEIEFPTENGLTAFGYFYPPRNKDFTGPSGQRPPLLVQSHGGPTRFSSAAFNLRVQYWTSRGFGVLDVNYGGSSGYGRTYRQRLNGQWGVVDVDDCVNGANYLARQGLVDPQRLAIEGGSAGGYTTLCAVTFRKVFKAGASHFGVSDAEALAQDTHKFESRYLDSLIGPYPQKRELYQARSPINHTDQLNCALILFQGLEDKVVPPNQAEKMFKAVKAKGLPVAYLAFEGEQHGFRRAENIKRTLDAQLYFFGKVFGFEPADPVEPVKIENL
jgi:dipeptidyl aminopeptidase/acylaminoacyl peptidase